MNFKILESFSIMDYSILLGIHNLDREIRANSGSAAQLEAYYESKLNELQSAQQQSVIINSNSTNSQSGFNNNANRTPHQHSQPHKVADSMFNM